MVSMGRKHNNQRTLRHGFEKRFYDTTGPFLGDFIPSLLKFDDLASLSGLLIESNV